MGFARGSLGSNYYGIDRSSIPHDDDEKREDYIPFREPRLDREPPPAACAPLPPFFSFSGKVGSRTGFKCAFAYIAPQEKLCLPFRRRARV
mmetsp:Transcript_17045/g.49194  ORF Transcript_17045/g.49194 Transcript_17045/m.49194 type:complete len:91 (-) Transcript_17045:84-356(-)